nr:uncharacterized protein LOC132438612 [Delphinus delphis]
MALGAQCTPTPRLSAGRHQQCPWRLWGNTSPGGGVGVGECCPPSSDSSKPSGSRCQGGSWTMWPLPQEWHLGGGPPRPKESLPFMVKLPPPQTPCMGGVAGRLEPAPLEPWVSPLPRLCLGPAQGAGEDGVNNLVKFRDAAVEVQLEGNARSEEAGACSPPTPPPVKLETAPWTSRPPSAHLGSAPASWGHWGTNPRMLGESPGGRSPGPRTRRRSGGGPGPRGRSQDADLRCQRLNPPYKTSPTRFRRGSPVTCDLPTQTLWASECIFTLFVSVVILLGIKFEPFPFNTLRSFPPPFDVGRLLSFCRKAFKEFPHRLCFFASVNLRSSHLHASGHPPNLATCTLIYRSFTQTPGHGSPCSEPRGFQSL